MSVGKWTIKEKSLDHIEQALFEAWLNATIAVFGWPGNKRTIRLEYVPIGPQWKPHDLGQEVLQVGITRISGSDLRRIYQIELFPNPVWGSPGRPQGTIILKETAYAVCEVEVTLENPDPEVTAALDRWRRMISPAIEPEAQTQPDDSPIPVGKLRWNDDDWRNYFDRKLLSPQTKPDYAAMAQETGKDQETVEKAYRRLITPKA